MLAVQPPQGDGIVLVGANGRGQHRVCTKVSVCGRPQRPMFSPDGRSLLLAGPAIRLIGTDGTCENCHFGVAASPAFEPGGTLITFVSGGRVLEDSIDGIRQDFPPVSVRGGAPVASAVWSAAGTLAAAAGGRIWVGEPRSLRRIAVGSAPSWSPNGSRIALVRHGWITVVRVSNGAVRRLVRGAAPAFSPDGRWIAFIGERHRVEVIPSGGGHIRTVEHVSGLAVDWQPLPSHPAACVAPRGAEVLARSRQAIVTAESGPKVSSSFGLLPETAAMGCLFTVGRERLLAHAAFNSENGATTFPAAAVGAPYAALVTRENDEHYGGDNRATAVFDLRTGARSGFGGESSSCFGMEAAPPCSGIDQVVVGSTGVSAVHVDGGPTSTTYSDVLGASCGSISLCVAYNGFGDVSSSGNPTASPWASTPLVRLNAMSCSSSSLCVGITNSSIYTSTNPTSGSAAWAQTPTPFGAPSSSSVTPLDNVTCTSNNLCVVTTWNGNVLVSSNPTGGASAWTIEDIDGSNALPGIACPSDSQCMATDSKGNLLTTTNPTGGPGAWATRQISSHGLDKITCPSASFCAVVEPPLQLAWSTDPTSGAWTTVDTQSTDEGMRDVSCPSASLCVAVGDAGTIWSSSAPATGSWTGYTLAGRWNLATVSCPTTTFCLAAGTGYGQVFISTNPAGGASSWTPVLADRIDCSNTPSACGTEQVIASDRAGLHTLDSSTEFEVQTGQQLTGLALTRDTLTWLNSGSPKSVALNP